MSLLLQVKTPIVLIGVLSNHGRRLNLQLIRSSYTRRQISWLWTQQCGKGRSSVSNSWQMYIEVLTRLLLRGHWTVAVWSWFVFLDCLPSVPTVGFIFSLPNSMGVKCCMWFLNLEKANKCFRVILQHLWKKYVWHLLWRYLLYIIFSAFFNHHYPITCFWQFLPSLEPLPWWP